MTRPKDGQFYATRTLLGGTPDRNRRTIYCWPSDEPVCVLNPHMEEWTNVHEAWLAIMLDALNTKRTC